MIRCLLLHESMSFSIKDPAVCKLTYQVTEELTHNLLRKRKFEDLESSRSRPADMARLAVAAFECTDHDRSEWARRAFDVLHRRDSEYVTNKTKSGRH